MAASSRKTDLCMKKNVVQRIFVRKNGIRKKMCQKKNEAVGKVYRVEEYQKDIEGRNCPKTEGIVIQGFF